MSGPGGAPRSSKATRAADAAPATTAAAPPAAGRAAAPEGGKPGEHAPVVFPSPASLPEAASHAPAPVIALTGSSKVADAFANTVNNLAAPFQNAVAPGQGVLARVSSAVNGVLGLMNAPTELMNTGIALATNFISAMLPSFPAATLTALHMGVPHPHMHPPSFVPPAPPVPLPSIGTVLMPGCLSVLINGIPAARVGDIGLAVTCGSLAPVFEIFTGSSKVFIGGKRAARMLDTTLHCTPEAPMSAMGLAMMLGPALLSSAVSAMEGNAMAAAMMAAQAAADTAAMALKALLGKDPGGCPDMGMLMIGHPNVLIGGIPLPDTEVIKAGLLKLLKGLKNGIRGGLGQGRLFCAACM